MMLVNPKRFRASESEKVERGQLRRQLVWTSDDLLIESNIDLASKIGENETDRDHSVICTSVP